MQPDRTPANARDIPGDYATRLAELQQMLEILDQTRTTARLDFQPRRFEGDPVALTQALHPRGLRRPRRSSRCAANSRPSAVRIVVFDGSAGPDSRT